ncbi:hypothetical protein [Intrasporangium sp.]|uniref:hypothetical protein n=1 Tax=Intrasporangium sp. TaxID=1925024 RepID=UPI0032221C74
MTTQTFEPQVEPGPVAEPVQSHTAAGPARGPDRDRGPGPADPDRVPRRSPAGHEPQPRGVSAGATRDFSGIPVGGPRAGATAPTTGPTARPRKGSDRGGFLQTVGSFFSGLFSHPGAALSHLFGGEGFTQTQLSTYLTGLSRRNDIEGDFDSDNKARAVVRRWSTAAAGFDLTGRQKALLVAEMLSGATTGDDEQAILDILTRSENGDLRLILQAVPVTRLLSDIGGANGRRLRAWLDTRFKGGLAEVRKDHVEPVGTLPANAPVFPYDFARLRERLEGPYRVGEIIEELSRHSPAEREQAARDLAVERDKLDARANDLGDRARKASSAAARSALEAQRDEVRTTMLKMDLVMQDAFKDIVRRESPAELTAKATKLTPAQKQAARDAIKPPVGGTPAAPTPFVSRLAPGQPSYEEKLRAASPGMIDSYWQQMAKDRKPADHSDPAKMHTLTEMEDLAKVSKDETDDVFGGYYDKSAHPPLRADTPGRRRNLHDLWADTQAFLTDPSTSFADKQAMAKALVFYFFQNDDDVVAPLNREHHASPSFSRTRRPLNDEAKAQGRIAAELTRTAPQVRKLNEIDRGWDASANPATKDVNIQLFRPKGGVTKDQDFMWDMFQTLIHEYLHTLAARRYRTFAASFGDGPQNSTLVEGMDSFLDEVVWANIQPRVGDQALRKKVEGPAYAALPPITVVPAFRRRYASYSEATRLVTVVGFRNVLLAYFKGEIDRIGG